jgi:predicted Zn-dependent peptidase
VLRRTLYELEDRDNEYREFWAEFNWYRRYGTIGYVDPVPASTEQEYLKIDIDLPKEHLELFFRLEADRMVNAVLRGWEAQRFTVLEQILNGLSRPEIRFNNALDGATAQAHPLYIPDGGHPRDFAFYNRAAMQRMYDEYFVPNNATLALVGDVTIEAARTLAERYFGRVPRGPEPPARLDLEGEPPPGGTIRVDWAEPLDPRVVVRYRIPGVGHPDRPVFDTIAALVRGRFGVMGSRLTRTVAPDVTVDADFRVIHTYRFGSPGAINFIALAHRDEDLPAVESAMLVSIADLRDGRIDPAALVRARKALRLDWEQIRLDRARLSTELGQFAIMDKWQTLEPYMVARQSASPEEVRRVARQYFIPANRVIATTRRAPAVAEAHESRAPSDRR